MSVKELRFEHTPGRGAARIAQPAGPSVCDKISPSPAAPARFDGARWSPAALVGLAVALAGCSGKTTGATNVNDTGARLNAVGSCDKTCSAYIRWRKAGSTTWTDSPVLAVGNKVTNAPWYRDATGLAPSTTYEYQACGKEPTYPRYVCVGPDGREATVDTFTTKGRQPPGFSESTVQSGLTQPTALRFAPDGRVFVAEKSGLIKVFDSTSDTTPTVFADLRTQVHNFWDRGLLGIALDPGFPAKPYVYVLYTYDAAIGGAAPRWGTPGVTGDACPTPPGPTDRRVRGERPALAPHGRAATP